ncbi:MULTISPECIES: tyrosine--tRNA ligase [unclassified Nitratiruptor]|uniref:tyrosine--tRNA ligase n=1 Tax=unclassified Nitratiruptor TaxID=2624044 RepID=UPI001915BE24|nr:MULTISPECIES: tyrosine--tRNA ligase [unclassified Nitratiruptor]BCD60518.1 tyrosyl-tRNA synthetase [Nitratiruptor sp. YY08-10]BCD63993.1 tyrosyl-tRNA synthetase [Nitratiruptor sp. YY08-14]
MLQEALAEIARGTAEIIDQERIEALLKDYFEHGKNYYVKAGFDPTAPDLHLGHTVLLQKLATFQKYGGIVQFIIGDFTAMIGDPTGKSETRKKLDRETVLKNAQSYKDQVFKVLDPAKTEVVFNSSWLDALGASGLVELTTLFSVARMLERDDFEKRYKAGRPIAISEFIYPLLQGYDSVHLKSDIEIGGTDQKFNLLMGRHLQRSFGIGKEQAVLMMPILEGLDGVQKMSKSLGNYVGVTEEPNEMFAKLMSISDELMWRYYELLSSKSLEEIQALKEGVEKGEIHPKFVKELLAMEIVERYHNAEAAKAAKEEFDRIHKKNDIPTDIKEVEMQGPVWIAKALVEAGLEPSTSQARRDIQAGAVRVNKEKVMDKDFHLQPGEYIVQVGKRKFAKVKVG